jgi:hypothetical protein
MSNPQDEPSWNGLLVRAVVGSLSYPIEYAKVLIQVSLLFVVPLSVYVNKCIPKLVVTYCIMQGKLERMICVCGT